MVNLFFYYIERLLYIACLLSVYIYAADARIETTYSFNTYGSVGLIILFLYTNLKTKYAFKVFFSLKKYIVLLFGILCHIPNLFVLDIGDSLSHFVLLFLVYFILIPGTNIKVVDFAVSSVFLNLYILYRSIFDIGIDFSLFAGTTINSNQFALVLIGGVIGALYLLIKKNSIVLTVLSIFSLLSSLFLIIISSSRTVMISAIFAIFYTLLQYLKMKQFSISRNLIFAIILMIVIVFGFSYYMEINKFLFSKWNVANADTLSGRFKIWTYIWNTVNIGGVGHSTINSNNEYLNYYLLYGPLVFIFYFLLSIWSFLRVKRIMSKGLSPETLYCFLVVCLFTLISMFENFYSIFGKNIHVMYWSVVGYLINFTPHHIKIICCKKNNNNGNTEIY